MHENLIPLSDAVLVNVLENNHCHKYCFDLNVLTMMPAFSVASAIDKSFFLLERENLMKEMKNSKVVI